MGGPAEGEGLQREGRWAEEPALQRKAKGSRYSQGNRARMDNDRLWQEARRSLREGGSRPLAYPPSRSPCWGSVLWARSGKRWGAGGTMLGLQVGMYEISMHPSVCVCVQGR